MSTTINGKSFDVLGSINDFFGDWIVPTLDTRRWLELSTFISSNLHEKVDNPRRNFIERSDYLHCGVRYMSRMQFSAKS
jgi:hypothetical protein